MSRRTKPPYPARNPKRCRNGLHAVSSPGNEGSREISFFWRASSTACRRISFSRVFLPSTRSYSRSWRLSSRTSEATKTSSSAWIACLPPSAIRLLQLKSRLGGIPYLRATYETDIPGSLLSRTARSLSAIENRRRRWISVITEIASISLLIHSHKPSRMTRRYQKALCLVEMGATPLGVRNFLLFGSI